MTPSPSMLEMKARWGIYRFPFIFPKRNPCLVMPEEFKWGLSSPVGCDKELCLLCSGNSDSSPKGNNEMPLPPPAGWCQRRPPGELGH